MRLTFERDRKGRIEFGIIYGVMTIFALLAARFLPVLTIFPACAFKSITGFPCPTCGSTRSLVHIAGGDILSAFGYNPLFSISLLFAVTAFVYGSFRLLFSLPRLAFLLSEAEKSFLKAALILAVLSNWAYLCLTL